MKALSIRQPWSYLICTGVKDVENRTWRTAFRGRIYVHAGQRVDRQRVDWPLGHLARGAIIGEVDIVDCVTESESPWYTGPFGFVLRNPQLYDVPIPYKGALGFFKARIEEDGVGV